MGARLSLGLRAANSGLRPFDQAAAYIAGQIGQAVRERGRCDLVLSGGRTPRGVYEQLAEAGAAVPWERVRWFWGDERFVPRDHASSNYRMALETILERIRPPAQNVFPMPVEAPSPEEAARRYERTLRGLFPGVNFPVFDLVLLGLGADGHTASLFPGGPECEEHSRWCLASLAPINSPPRRRVTLSLPALNTARAVAFLVAGEKKRDVLRALLSPQTAGELPAQRIRAAGAPVIFTDLLPALAGDGMAR
jgi:6-phosphogluconolactonase